MSLSGCVSVWVVCQLNAKLFTVRGSSSELSLVGEHGTRKEVGKMEG